MKTDCAPADRVYSATGDVVSCLPNTGLDVTAIALLGLGLLLLGVAIAVLMRADEGTP